MPSNVFLTQRWPTFDLTGNVFWYRDLTQAKPVALQRLPQLFFDGAPQPVPGLPGFLYQFQTSAVNFVRDVGSEGGRLAVQPMVSRPIRIADVVTVTPFAGAIVTAYTKTVTGTQTVATGLVVEETSDDPLVRPPRRGRRRGDRPQLAASTRAGFWGIDALLHVIEPRVNYTFIGGRDTEGVPQWTELDRIPTASLVTYSLINRLFARSIAPPGTEPIKLEVGRLTLSQSYDALKRPRRPGRPFFAELILNPSPILYFRGRRHLRRLRRPGCSPPPPNLGVVRPHFGAAIGTTLQQARQRELRAGNGQRRHHPLRDRALPDQLGRAVGKVRGEPLRRGRQVPVLGPDRSSTSRATRATTSSASP